MDLLGWAVGPMDGALEAHAACTNFVCMVGWKVYAKYGVPGRCSLARATVCIFEVTTEAVLESVSG